MDRRHLRFVVYPDYDGRYTASMKKYWDMWQQRHIVNRSVSKGVGNDDPNNPRK
jgi:hypothetical protein